MDLKTLKYFVTVAEELNITRAAKLLNMSQPPLSSQIKLLEKELNTELFIRSKKQLTLTSSGEYLYQKARDIINLVDKTKDDIVNMAEGLKGTITLGLVEGMAPSIASSWIEQYLKTRPNIAFKIYASTTLHIMEKLRSGLLHIAIITGPYDENLLNAIEVGKENMVAIINTNHKLAKSSNILKVKDLKNEKLITPSNKEMLIQIRRWFKKENLEPKIVCMLDNYLEALSLVSNNVGISIFPVNKAITNKSLLTREIDIKDKEIKYYFVWKKDYPLPKIEQDLVDLIKKYYIKK